jgi:hypothetical protein
MAKPVREWLAMKFDIIALCTVIFCAAFALGVWMVFLTCNVT